jgi:hypothetical protein
VAQEEPDQAERGHDGEEDEGPVKETSRREGKEGKG